MEVIYADSLVLLNAVIDYLLLLSAGKLCALPLRRGRMALGALWGGAYALACAAMGGVLTHPLIKLAAGAVAVFLAFGVKTRPLRAVLAFYGAAAAFAGAVYAAMGLAGLPRETGLLLPVSMRVLVLSFALSYAVIALAFRSVGRRAERVLCTVELEFCGRLVTLRALRDTGNELTDPLTGCGVVIVQSEALRPLLPGAELCAQDVSAALEAANALWPGRFRLVPCAGVTAERALLLCFRPDAVYVDGHRRRDLLAAVSPRVLCPDGEYAAIVK